MHRKYSFNTNFFSKIRRLFLFALILLTSMAFASGEWEDIVTIAYREDFENPSEAAIQKCNDVLFSYAVSCSNQYRHLEVEEAGCHLVSSDQDSATAKVKVRCYD